MAVTILIGNAIVLKLLPVPIPQAVFIAFVSNSLGKLFVSVLHFPAALGYSLPTLAFFVLSFYYFKPTLKSLIIYWLVGFAAYLIIHMAISALFDWTFMFPFWDFKI